MFDSITAVIRAVDWSVYRISVFEMLIAILALTANLNLITTVVLTYILGRGFLIVESGTDFQGPVTQLIPFIVYTMSSLIFIGYSLLKSFSRDK